MCPDYIPVSIAFQSQAKILRCNFFFQQNMHGIAIGMDATFTILTMFIFQHCWFHERLLAPLFTVSSKASRASFTHKCNYFYAITMFA
jgi:hypothetical protein